MSNYAGKCRCGSLEIYCRGCCKKCYYYSYRNNQTNKVKAKQNKHDWYVANVQGTDRQRLAREEAHFDGNRELVLERDDYKCTECGSTNKLIVHHKDGNGRGSKIKNNELDNLVTLCRSCHVNVHRKELLEAREWKNKLAKVNKI